MQQIQSAGFVLFRTHNNEQLYLLLQYRGKHWDFPKGKLELHETKLQAAMRELKEETGLDATIHSDFETTIEYTFIDIDTIEKHKTVFFFIAQTDSSSVQLSEEHIAYAWLPFEQALERLTYENAKKVLRQARDFIKT